MDIGTGMGSHNSLHHAVGQVKIAVSKIPAYWAIDCI